MKAWLYGRDLHQNPLEILLMDSFANTKAFTNDNTIPQKITLTPDSNAKRVTLVNTFSKSQRSFIEKAYDINVEEQRPFCLLDYPLLSHGNFRIIIHKLGNNIERVGSSRPQFYKLKGIKLPGDTRKVTLDPTRVTDQDLIELLHGLKDQPPKIHDIKIKIENSELHASLLDKGLTKDSHNHSIKVNCPVFDANITTKILVYHNIFCILHTFALLVTFLSYPCRSTLH